MGTHSLRRALSFTADPTQALRTRLAGLGRPHCATPTSSDWEQRRACPAPPQSHGCSWPLSQRSCVEPTRLFLGAGLVDGPRAYQLTSEPRQGPGDPVQALGGGGSWGCVTGPARGARAVPRPGVGAVSGTPPAKHGLLLQGTLSTGYGDPSFHHGCSVGGPPAVVTLGVPVFPACRWSHEPPRVPRWP